MQYHIRSGLFRILRVTLIVLLLIGAAVWLRGILTSLNSEQAVVNAEIIQIRTPIAGQLKMSNIRPGVLLKKGDTLFTVENSHFGDQGSVSQYNALLSQADALQGEILGAENTVNQERITLEKNRHLYQLGAIARIVLQEAETRFENAKSVAQAKREQLVRTQTRVKEMAGQSALQKESVVTMPEDGLVWAMAGKPGEQVDANHLVMEVINPSHIWVDAFFTERHANELKPGLPAVISSLDSAASWRGSLESVRAGVGRLAYDTTVAVPPPEMVKRQIAVRVAVTWERPFGPEAFYGVGRSVEVTFLKGKTQRTRADALKEKFERFFSGSKKRLTGASTDS
jgi:multidrug resistance efflux pump